MSQAPEMREIKTAELMLDLENPRFLYLKHQGDGHALTQEQVEKEIAENDDDIPLLIKTIQKDGVKDPIWVIPRNGHFLVMEGNRRSVVLKKLLKEGVVPPPGVRYDVVRAHVLPSDTPPVELVLQKARLQAGKKAWGAFNEAALTFQLREPPFLMALEDIAVDLKIPIAKVRERIENYKLFKKYIETTGDDNPKRFAFFNECPSKVREWFRDNDKNELAFFRLINPLEGKNKIKSVSTRGGLRDFAKVLESPDALKFLLDDPSATVEDALDLAKENDIRKAIPFFNRIAPMAQDLRGLDLSQIERLKEEVKFKVALKALRAACDEVLTKIEK